MSIKSAKPRKDGVGVGNGSRTGRDGSEIDDRSEINGGEINGGEINGGEINGGEINGGEIRNDEVGKKVQKPSKSKNLSKSKKIVGFLDFLIPGAKLVFTKLRQVFLKAPILYHFYSKRHI